MTQDLNTTAMQRYHDRFDNDQYSAIGELLASNLYTERDDQRVIDGMIAVQNAAFELCGHPDFDGAWHKLAVFCGQHSISFHTVDAIRDFLRRFSQDDTRIDDFEATAKGMLRAYSGLDDLKTATAHANGVHGWRGRMAYELLAAVEYLTHTAITLLAHGDETYIREKLRNGLHRITGALYEGVRHSEQPSLYNFRSTYFPDERDA
ncbi:MAG: hypothetical protein BroJett007_10770 [Chloroflexota bacterium]|nr:MAG: hypothetical protein BroJett007_10770 [Chloroflexota bacterium]